MPAPKKIKMRVLLAQDPLDPTPYIVGGVDEKTYDAMTEHEWDQAASAWVERLGIHVWEWEMAGCWITVSTSSLKAVFDPKPIAAEVEA